MIQRKGGRGGPFEGNFSSNGQRTKKRCQRVRKSRIKRGGKRGDHRPEVGPTRPNEQKTAERRKSKRKKKKLAKEPRENPASPNLRKTHVRGRTKSKEEKRA